MTARTAWSFSLLDILLITTHCGLAVAFFLAYREGESLRRSLVLPASAHISADGKTAAVSNDRGHLLFDVATGERRSTMLSDAKVSSRVLLGGEMRIADYASDSQRMEIFHLDTNRTEMVDFPLSI